MASFMQNGLNIKSQQQTRTKLDNQGPYNTNNKNGQNSIQLAGTETIVDDALIKRLGTFPKVQLQISNNGALNQIRSKQQQDTSPMRGTYDAQSYVQNQTYNATNPHAFMTNSSSAVNNINQGLPQSQASHLQQQYYRNNSEIQQNENWNNNQALSSMTNSRPGVGGNTLNKQRVPGPSSNKQQFLSQNINNTNKMIGTGVGPSQQYFSQTSGQFDKSNSYQGGPNSSTSSYRQQQHPNVNYEQMSQNLNLESLIQQAKQRNVMTDANVLQTTIQYDFKNKINKFKGDNDYVEEELDTSNEDEVKSADETHQQDEQNNNQQESEDDNESPVDDQYDEGKQNSNEDESDIYESPLKQNFMNQAAQGDDQSELTPGCNLLMSSGGISAVEPEAIQYSENQLKYQAQDPILSDLSQKVAYLNIPFGRTPLYQNYQVQNQSLSQVQSQGILDGVIDDHQLEYSASASALNLKNQNQDIVGALSKGVTPFQFLTKDYMNKKSEVVNKYSNINSDQDEQQEVEEDDDEQEEVSFLDPTDRTETPTERIQQQEAQNDVQQQDALDIPLTKDDLVALSESKQPTYRTAQDCQYTYRNEEDLGLINDPLMDTKLFLSPNNFESNNNNNNNIYKDSQAMFTFKPIQSQIQNQEEQNLQQKQEIQDQSTLQESIRNTKSRQDNEKFLTLDDFIRRESQKKVQFPDQTFSMTDEKVLQQSQRSGLQDDKSPRIVDKSHLLQREKDQEIKKKQQLEMLKNKAIEKEKIWIKRMKAAVIIQKWVRGFLKRVQFAKMQQNFRYMRKLRRILSIAYGKIRTKKVKQLINMLKEAGTQVKTEKDDLMQKYLDHCATEVQKLWRGYHARNYQIQDLIAENKRKRLLCAVIKGWKIRKILTSCKEVIAIKRSLCEIENSLRQTGGRNNQQLASLMQERRVKVGELCKVLPILYKNGRWIYSKQKRPQGISSKNKNTKSNNIVDFRQEQEKQYQHHHYMSQMSQVQAPSRPLTGGDKIIQLPLQRLPSQQFKIVQDDMINQSIYGNRQIHNQQDETQIQQKHESRSFVNENKNKPLQQNYMHDNPPSQHHYNQSIQQFQGEFQNYQKQQDSQFNAAPQPFRQPIKSSNVLNQISVGGNGDHQLSFEKPERQLQIGWPSRQQPDTHSEEESQIMWASSALNSLQQSKRQLDSKGPIFQQKQNDRNMQHSFDKQNAELQTERTAIGEKLEILGKQTNHPQLANRQGNQRQNEDEVNQSQYYSQSRYQSSQKLDQIAEKSDAFQKPSFDDMPIRPSKPQNIDNSLEQIKRSSQQVSGAKEYDSQTSVNKINLHDEKPIRSKINQSMYQSQDDSSIQIKPPKYNFEDMIEEALGQQPNNEEQMNKNITKSKAVAQRSKTTRNVSQNSNNQSDDENDDQEQEKQNEPKTKKNIKKQNLQKRQKYDPRKAIEEAKKTQEKEEKPSKSSFPEGVLTKNERTKSATGLPRVNDEEFKQETVNTQVGAKKAPKPANKKKNIQQQQQIQEQEYQQQQMDDLDGNENGHQSSTNASSIQGSKAFLKRKSKQVLNFSKCNWNAKSRVSCWTNNKTDRSNNQSQTRKTTSQIRSPRIDITPKMGQQEQAASSFSQNNKKASIGANQAHYNSTNTVGLNKAQQQQQQIAPKNQKSLPQLKPQAIQQLQQQQQYYQQQHQQQQQYLQLQQNPQSYQQLQQTYQQPQQQIYQHPSSSQGNKQTFIQEDAFDAVSIPDENDQVRMAIVQNNRANDYGNEVYESQKQFKAQQQQQQDNSLMLTQHTMSHMGGQTEDASIYENSQAVDLQQDNVTLQLEELEKIIELFHPKPQSFEDSEIRESRRQTCVPHMSLNSMFFNCYSDEIYDTILEDLREHYITLCNE